MANDLLSRLDAMARAEHDDLSVAAEAAEEIRRLRQGLAVVRECAAREAEAVTTRFRTKRDDEPDGFLALRWNALADGATEAAKAIRKLDLNGQGAAMMRERDRLAAELERAKIDGASPFQGRVWAWVLACFGEEVARDRAERNRRFLEEALELVQSLGCTRADAVDMVEYVFDRDQGESAQEVGGVLVTRAALCSAAGVSMSAAGETEIARVLGNIDAIRAKQAAKPRHIAIRAQIEEKAGE